jgi:hypothetical protein
MWIMLTDRMYEGEISLGNIADHVVAQSCVFVTVTVTVTWFKTCLNTP